MFKFIEHVVRYYKVYFQVNLWYKVSGIGWYRHVETNLAWHMLENTFLLPLAPGQLLLVFARRQPRWPFKVLKRSLESDRFQIHEMKAQGCALTCSSMS